VVPTRHIHERVPRSQLLREEQEPFAFVRAAVREKPEVAKHVDLTHAGACEVPDRELDPLQVSVWIAEQTDALVDERVPVSHQCGALPRCRPRFAAASFLT
jgi:hypothetical protein